MVLLVKRPHKRQSERRAGPCQKCGTERPSLHRDHIQPLWAGGSNEPFNIQYICANCHQDKTTAECQSPEYRALKSRAMTPERRALARERTHRRGRLPARERPVPSIVVVDAAVRLLEQQLWILNSLEIATGLALPREMVKAALLDGVSRGRARKMGRDLYAAASYKRPSEVREAAGA